MERNGVDACIVHNGKILIGKRSADEGAFAGHWELPGGKLEGGETPQQGLIREMREELGVHVSVGEQIYSYEYDHNGTHFRWQVYRAALLDEPSSIQLFAHDAIRWIRSVNELNGLLLSDTMRKTIIACLSRLPQ